MTRSKERLTRWQVSLVFRPPAQNRAIVVDTSWTRSLGRLHQARGVGEGKGDKGQG